MEAKILIRLKESFLLYSFFWEEWTNNGNCNLTKSEVELINLYIQIDFKPHYISRQWDKETFDNITIVLKKLEFGYQVFKDFVIVNFLQTVIDIAVKYGYDDFLTTHISHLKIDADLRNSLSKLKTHNLQLAFIVYKPEDFGRKWLFNVIQEFQTINKQKKEYLLIKTKNEP